MSSAVRRHLYLPASDRSFWTSAGRAACPLLYLAWGARDFARQPIPPSRHEGWVAVLIEEGGPTLLVKRREVRMPAGTLALIGPECPFGWTGASTGSAKFLLWMWRGLAAPAAAGAYLTRTLARPDRRSFALLHDLCRREVLRPPGPTDVYLDGCRILFEATMQRALLDPSAADSSASRLVDLARTWLAAHLDSREPVARVCDYLNVSQSTLYRVFAAACGESPLAWFHRTRMEKARELIVDRRQPVKATAYALGYQHSNDLSRAYRRHFGHRPTVAAAAALALPSSCMRE